MRPCARCWPPYKEVLMSRAKAINELKRERSFGDLVTEETRAQGGVEWDAEALRRFRDFARAEVDRLRG